MLVLTHIAVMTYYSQCLKPIAGLSAVASRLSTVRSPAFGRTPDGLTTNGVSSNDYEA